MQRLLLLCVVILGCGPQRRLEPCSPSATGVVAPPTLVTLVGQPVDVELVLAPAVFCPKGNPVATDVFTEVLDALNQPVPHVHSAPTSSNTVGYTTHITFTPARAGVHYLTARYEPALGLAQRQLQVALDRSDEVPFLRTTLGTPCDEVLPLRDAVLCRRGTRLTVVRDGGVTSSETISAMASAGATVWLWTDARVSRLVDVDGGFERDDFVLSVADGGIGVTSTRWVQGFEAQFVELRVSDAGLSQRRWSVDSAFAPVTGPGLGLAEDVVGWVAPRKVCAGAPDASVRCVDSVLQPLVGERDAIWLRGVESGVLALARVSRDGAEPVVLFVPAQSAALMDARQSRPVFSWNGHTVAVRADDLSFEAWRSPTSLAKQATVTDSFVVFQLASGETVIYRR